MIRRLVLTGLLWIEAGGIIGRLIQHLVIAQIGRRLLRWWRCARTGDRTIIVVKRLLTICYTICIATAAAAITIVVRDQVIAGRSAVRIHTVI